MLPGSSSSLNNEAQNPPTSSASGSGSSSSSITNDLSALGQAIQSGNLTGAQNDFSKLMQDMQSIGGGHHHHHHHKASASSQDTAIASTSGASTGTNSIAADLAALGQAIQSGDVKNAGDAYSQLTQDMQSLKQGNQSQNASAELQSPNSTNSNAGFQQLLNMWTQVISAGSTINTSA
jgi:hypothetical protein